MSKLPFAILLALAAASASAAQSAIIGQDAATCRAGKPSVIVRVSGLKKPTGQLKIGVYESGRFLQKRGTISKDKITVRSTGPFDVCLSVPGPGR
jgi:uncharacterized protein (DUF2141 family)